MVDILKANADGGQMNDEMTEYQFKEVNTELVIEVVINMKDGNDLQWVVWWQMYTWMGSLKQQN